MSEMEARIQKLVDAMLEAALTVDEAEPSDVVAAAVSVAVQIAWVGVKETSLVRPALTECMDIYIEQAIQTGLPNIGALQ